MCERLKILINNGIFIENKRFILNVKCGGDMVFIAHMLGINTNFQNAKNFCVWCEIPRDECFLTDENWSINDTNKGARTIERAKEYCTKKKGEQIGYIKQPISDFIKFQNFVFDPLHLNLNISKTLINLFLDTLDTIDSFLSNVSSDLEKLQFQKKLFDEIILKTSIKKPFKLVDNKYRINSLTSIQFLNIIKEIKVSQLFPPTTSNKRIDNLFERNYQIEKLWKDYYSIYVSAKDNTYDQIEFLKEKTREWKLKFNICYNRSNYTPYIHLFVDHLHQFVALHGDINKFSCQGLEKTNHLNTKNYHLSSNRHMNVDHENLFNKHTDEDNYLKQMKKKRNRIDFLSIQEEREIKRRKRIPKIQKN